MANLKISELIQRAPDGTEFLEVIIPPFGSGTNRKVLLQDIIDLAAGGTVTSITGTTSRIDVDLTDPAVPEIDIDSAYDATHINGRPVVAATGTVISFAVPQTYGTIAAPETGNITKNATGAVVGMVQLLIHALYNSTPTFGSEFVLLGSYTPTETNYIYMELLADGNILTTIRTAV